MSSTTSQGHPTIYQSMRLDVDLIQMSNIEFSPNTKVTIAKDKKKAKLVIKNMQEHEILLEFETNAAVRVNPRSCIIPDGCDGTFAITSKVSLTEKTAPQIAFQVRVSAIQRNPFRACEIREDISLKQDLVFGNCHYKKFFLVFEAYNQAPWWPVSEPSFGAIKYEDLPPKLQQVYTFPAKPPPSENNGSLETSVEMPEDGVMNDENPVLETEEATNNEENENY